MAIAFLFAGQGAQYPGMGRKLYDHSSAAKKVMDRCEAIQAGILAWCFTGTKEELDRTIHTQPCLFMVDIACGFALEEQGIMPDAVAGFSLGEWAAAVFSGMLTIEEAFVLVLKRAEAMQACAERYPGAMAAVLRLSPEQVERICREIGNVYPVNYNCPRQTVVSGDGQAIAALKERVTSLRGRVVSLPVSGPFHTPYMEEAAGKMRVELSGVTMHPLKIPFYANVDAQRYGMDGAERLSTQIKSPVRWQETMESLWRDGHDTFVELGPGKILSGFASRMDLPLRIYHVEDVQSLQETTKDLGEK